MSKPKTPQSRWTCACGASGWWTPSTHIGPHPLDDHECREVARSAARKMALELVTACRQDLEAYDLETRTNGPSPIPREYYVNALARALERLECAP